MAPKNELIPPRAKAMNPEFVKKRPVPKSM